ncbi:unnamed protein product [marine sediment metagenome]|uniref:Uncharacterized protein n=1 Tax=marine sediment metagenome TaxID=412755 RepID=X0SKH4_9ZZZZ
MNPDPTSNDYFPIRIPFEVWDLDAEGGPAQIDIIILDRMQSVSAGGDFYAFNPYNRMYCHILHKPYSEAVADPDDADCEFLTWNLVFWGTDWVADDKVVFQYDNPILLGVDVFTFETVKTVGDVELAELDVEMINVFPNPYYASNPGETNRFDRFVTFNHLPPLSVSETTIRIFNLAGVQVRKFEKDDETQFVKWDLKNESGLPVASGIYIAYVDMPDLGKQKVLKVFIVQSKQMLQYY